MKNEEFRYDSKMWRVGVCQWAGQLLSMQVQHNEDDRTECRMQQLAANGDNEHE